jgi:hypothetical protein
MPMSALNEPTMNNQPDTSSDPPPEALVDPTMDTLSDFPIIECPLGANDNLFFNQGSEQSYSSPELDDNAIRELS